MSTTLGVFGTATAYAAPMTRQNQAAGLDPLAAIKRHVQAVLLQGSGGTGVTSAVLNIVSTRAPIAVEGTQASPAAAPAPCIGVPELLERVRSKSGLTLEEIAHLMRVSRRTVHNWKVDEPISSGNEARLRDLDHAVRRISGTDSDARAVRARLMSRADGGLSPFDLLAEGRYEIAIALATGTSPIAGGEPQRDGIDPALAARLDPISRIDPIDSPKLLSRRLRSNRR